MSYSHLHHSAQPPGDVQPLCDWSAEDIRRIGYRVVDVIATYLTELPSRPVFAPVPGNVIDSFMTTAAPQEGLPADVVVDEVAHRVMQWPFGNGHPRFYAWVNSTPAVMGIFAEALAAAMNPSCAGGNHAAVYVERQVIAWYREMLGLPDSWTGLLVSGGSMAALTALAAARHARCGFDVRRDGLQNDHRPLVVYRSPEGHTCHQKAIELLGIGSGHMRVIPCDAGRRLSAGAFEQAVREDIGRELLPLALVASCGTVNTGAVDPLDELADVCSRYGIWLHVDAAYGGPAVLSRRYGQLAPMLARADSIAIDPHKWLFVPVEAGAVLVRNGQSLRDAFSLVPPYIQPKSRFDSDQAPVIDPVYGPTWFSEYGFQQTRGFRALKCWMVMKQVGLQAYREAVERSIALANRFADCLKETDDFELFEPRGMSIVCFRYRPAGVAATDIDLVNKRLLEALQLGGRYFLSGTSLDDRFYLRICVVNGRASEQDIDGLLPALREVLHSPSF
jgi:aromatic-L-amino-acid/L-tryptophan decarboxylase